MGILNNLLLLACAVQMIVILYIVDLLLIEKAKIITSSSKESISSIEVPINPKEKNQMNIQSTSHLETMKLEGQAATLMLHEPKWFQRRYSYMIINVLGNLPENWKLQIFYTAKGQSQAGIDNNIGLQRLIQDKKVILTLIPEVISSRKRRRHHIMTDKWFWENMIADRVFLFGGNSVICSNSPYTIRDFMHFDYIGTPWRMFDGNGGDGGTGFSGASFRNKQAMLDAINYEISKDHDDPNYDLNLGQEDMFFLTRLKELESLYASQNHRDNIHKYKGKYNIASRQDTLRFGGGSDSLNESVLVVSSTVPDVDFKTRDVFINTCPEWKMLFPVLHDPSCYGADPESDKCAASICALKPKEERPSGCKHTTYLSYKTELSFICLDRYLKRWSINIK